MLSLVTATYFFIKCLSFSYEATAVPLIRTSANPLAHALVNTLYLCDTILPNPSFLCVERPALFCVALLVLFVSRYLSALSRATCAICVTLTCALCVTLLALFVVSYLCRTVDLLHHSLTHYRHAPVAPVCFLRPQETQNLTLSSSRLDCH